MYFIDDRIRVICEQLSGQMRRTLCPIEGVTWCPTGYKNECSFPAEEEFVPFDPHLTFGGRDAHYWFAFTIRTPEKKADHEVYFSLTTGKEGQWDATNPQGILYLDGKLMQGLDTNHTEALLEYGREYKALVYFYVGMHEELVAFRPALIELDKRVEAAYYDFKVPLDGAMVLSPKDNNRIQTLKQLEKAESFLDMRDPFSDAYYEGLAAARAYLENEFYGKLCGKSDASVSCIGHTHIDVAWLWTLAQTREKAQRSFATVIRMMEQYPEYIFMSSQPQLYKYVKEEAPELYGEIKKAVAAGRWEVEGAMWLEADCNLSSGESLVRQIVHGKRFMKEEFGVDSQILWLPDVFGYSVALPQILKKTGVKKFVTSKISWNETNKLPYDAFMWQGLDGSEVFTYFITARDHTPEGVPDNGTTYVGYIRPSQVLGTWERFQQKDYNNETMITFGFGDGGGGPTRDMLEQEKRLHRGLPGFPTTKIEKAGDLLDRVEKNFHDNCAFIGRTPRWVGELYLEYHRGTYTSIAKNKKNNRQSELLLQETEKAAVTAGLLCGQSYPAQDIYDSWETVLLNQFHDIIPGSSIFEVYEDCDKMYAAIREKNEKYRMDSLSLLASRTKGKGHWVYNPLSFPVSGCYTADGETHYAENVPAMGWKLVEEKTPCCGVKIQAEESRAENAFFVLTVNEKGGITLTDKKNGREVFTPERPGNVLEAFEDFPRAYDDWEITSYYKTKRFPVEDIREITPVYDGVRAGFRIARNFAKSTITQTIWLYTDLDRIDVDTDLDWHEHHIILKAAFPTDIHATEATYDVQFGNVTRPTHSNTSWDAAKFEVCAHKWADISDAGYGFSILNNAKYGHNAEGSTLKLTLLKCGTYPNPEADQGHHSFTYSLYPHAGSWREADTVRMAYALNEPMTAISIDNARGDLADEYSFLSCENKNIICETVKQGYDGNSTVFRAYECADMRTNAKFRLGSPECFTKAYLCDMQENPLRELAITDGMIELPMGNYEIVTLKLV